MIHKELNEKKSLNNFKYHIPQKEQMGKFRIENYNFCKEKTLDDPNNRFKKIDIKKVLNF